MLEDGIGNRIFQEFPENASQRTCTHTSVFLIFLIASALRTTQPDGPQVFDTLTVVKESQNLKEGLEDKRAKD